MLSYRALKVLNCDIKPSDACAVSAEGKENVEKTIPVSLQNLQGCTINFTFN